MFITSEKLLTGFETSEEISIQKSNFIKINSLSCIISKSSSCD